MSDTNSHTAGTAKFLEMVYAGAPGFLSLWSGSTKKTEFFAVGELSQAVDHVSTASKDLFVGTATRRARLDPSRRGGSDDLQALSAVWMDVDIAGPAHSSTKLPASESEALAFLRCLPCPPSLIVQSGNGLHAWWLLTAPHDLTVPASREMAARASSAFQREIISRGAEKGWRLDSTPDLARALRIPGTWNGKSFPPKPVVMLEAHPERRYSLATLAEIAPVATLDSSDDDVLTRIERGVEEGERDQTLFAYAVLLRDRGESREEAEALVVSAARRCRPPFPEASARAKVANAFKKPSKAGGEQRTIDLLIECAEGIDFFHDEDHEYARVANREIHRVPSQSFADVLRRRLYERHGKAASATALTSASGLLKMRARIDGDRREVHLRVAEVGDSICIDLCDEGWRVIEVSRSGWQLLEKSPVMFRRTSGMRPLPVPVRGGSINELRRFVNLPDERQWMLFVGYLVGCFRTCAPFPVLAVNGPQGSAKSTLVRMARSLVDPNKVPLRLPPASPEDLIVAASKSWLLVFDNVSSISPILADALCMLSTGGGLSKRALYTDDDEVLVEAKRAIVLNGIEDLVARHDLADRAIVLSLPQISGGAREGIELEKAFEEARGRILGALLDGVAAALNNERSFKALPAVSRMADFTTWGMGACAAFGWDPNAFYAAHAANRNEAVEQANDGDLVVSAMRLHASGYPEWTGTLSQLFNELNSLLSEDVRRSKGWPQAPNALSGRLKRASHGLAASGIEVTFLARDPGLSRAKRIRIRRSIGLAGPTDQAPTVAAGTHPSLAAPFPLMQLPVMPPPPPQYPASPAAPRPATQSPSPVPTLPSAEHSPAPSAPQSALSQETRSARRGRSLLTGEK